MAELRRAAVAAAAAAAAVVGEAVVHKAAVERVDRGLGGNLAEILLNIVRDMAQEDIQVLDMVDREKAQRVHSWAGSCVHVAERRLPSYPQKMAGSRGCEVVV